MPDILGTTAALAYYGMASNGLLAGRNCGRWKENESPSWLEVQMLGPKSHILLRPEGHTIQVAKETVFRRAL